MRQKIIIIISLILFGVVVFLMFSDFFRSPGKIEMNSLDSVYNKMKWVDTSLIKYKETQFLHHTLTEASGIAIDSSLNIYIAGSGKVQIINANGKVVSDFKIDSAARCIALGSSNEIFIGIGNRIEVYNNKGVKQTSWKEYNHKSLITSIAVRNNDVFVADAANRLVLHYSNKGELKNIIGKKDSSRNVDGLVVPSPYLDVAIDPFDNLWVVNPGKHQLYNFADNGNLRSSWGKTSMTAIDGFTGCCNPAQFCFDADGSFITFEKKANRIKIYNQGGEFQCIVAGANSFTKFKSETNTDPLVKDVAVNKNGLIYALEAASNGIRVFAKK
jgi:hypothetical protein